MAAASQAFDTARQEAETANAKLELMKRHQQITMRLANSAMGSNKRSIDAMLKGSSELGTENPTKAAIRQGIDEMSSSDVKDRLARHQGARLGGSITQCRHRLYLLECGESYPVEEGEEDDDEEIANAYNIEDEAELLRKKKDCEDKLKDLRKARKLATPEVRLATVGLTIQRMDDALKDIKCTENTDDLENGQIVMFRYVLGDTPGMLQFCKVSNKEVIEGGCLLQRLENSGVPLKDKFDLYMKASMSRHAVIDKKQIDKILKTLSDATKNTGSSGSSTAESAQTSPLASPRDSGSANGTNVTEATDVTEATNVTDVTDVPPEWTLERLQAAVDDMSIVVVAGNGNTLTGGSRASWIARKIRDYSR